LDIANLCHRSIRLAARLLATTTRDKVAANSQTDGAATMAADGTWNIAIETPMGTRNTTLVLKTDGGNLTGTQSEGSNSTEIAEGKVSGDQLSWKVSITNPMPMDLDFTAEVSGDKISGQAATAMFGSFPFTGSRA
jgi:hypothetical protein